MGPVRPLALATVWSLALATCAAATAGSAHPPSGAFIDLSVSVLGASMDGNYTKAEKAIGKLIEDGEACVGAGHGDCVSSLDGVAFDLSTGRHKVTLLANSGYVGDDRLVATEAGSRMRIVDGGAYLYALGAQKVRIIQDYRVMCGIR